MVNLAASAAPGSVNRHRIVPELDGVRGIAILMVLLYHFKGRPPAVIPTAVYFPLLLGWSGVDLFFCLSGFLITGILIDSRGASNYFSSFYARRVLRIFPLYLLAVLVYFHVLMPIAHHLHYWPYNDHSLELWYWLHLSNWKSAFSLDHALLTHFWSLAIEEQFYLVWPLVVLLVRPSSLPYVCGLLVAIPLGLRCFYVDTTVVELLHRLTPFRIDTLAFGGLAAVIVRNEAWKDAVARHLRWPVLLAIGALVLALLEARTTDSGSPWITTLGYSSFGLLYTCFIFSAFVNSGSSSWLATQLRRPVLRNFGKYSYGIYVLHNPLAYYMSSVASRIEATVSAPVQIAIWIALMAVGISLSYGIALISWNLMEKHFLKLKDRFAVVRD